MSDIENRIGITPLDDLLDKRHNLVQQMAAGWALYGPGGVAESTRNAERCRIVGKLRADAARKGEKITEAALETGSRAHPDYLDLMARQTTERAEFFQQQEQLTVFDFEIRRGDALIRAFTSEPKT